MSTKPIIAFAGLGAMGYGMCSQLLKSGFPVAAYDPYQPCLDRIVAEGARQTQSPRDVAKDAQFFICMVANQHQANSLLFDSQNGAVANMPKRATVIICSTVAPVYIGEVRKHLDELGRTDIRLIDSPVSGGAARAANGTLSIFASGEASHLDAVSPILSWISAERKLYNVGGLGDGSKAKLVHQIFAGIHIAMASEAMGLAAKAGMNTRTAFEELNQGPGSSWVFGHRVPPMLDPTLPPYSAMTIIAKDVGIITSTSRDFRFPLPLLSVCEQLYQQAISSGFATEDDCALVRVYLPREQDLVSRQTNAEVKSDDLSISVDDIKNLMIGVHLAAISEAMSFSEKLGMDIDLMYEIIVNAAGASKAFEKEFVSMRNARWSLKGVTRIEAVREALMASVTKAYDLRYPLFLSSAALQEFHRQLR